MTAIEDIDTRGLGVLFCEQCGTRFDVPPSKRPGSRGAPHRKCPGCKQLSCRRCWPNGARKCVDCRERTARRVSEAAVPAVKSAGSNRSILVEDPGRDSTQAPGRTRPPRTVVLSGPAPIAPPIGNPAGATAVDAARRRLGLAPIEPLTIDQPVRPIAATTATPRRWGSGSPADLGIVRAQPHPLARPSRVAVSPPSEDPPRWEVLAWWLAGALAVLTLLVALIVLLPGAAAST